MPKAPKEPKEKKEKAGGKKKADKDPNAPKKPASAYMLFSSAKRAEVKAENPDAGFGEIGKLLGAAWKDVSDAEKKKYEALAKEAKEQYEKDLAEYKKSGGGKAEKADDDDEE
ncbi:high mobility group box domain-containing protein [Hyaloraphidium curvatum]|nr:high mobility group box domain-containing protein [Hyaloraphidium curvatum]